MRSASMRGIQPVSASRGSTSYSLPSNVELEKIDVLELELLEHFSHISDLSGRHFDVPLLREIVVGKETGTRSLNSHRQGVVTTTQAVIEDGYVLIMSRAHVKTLKRTRIRLEG